MATPDLDPLLLDPTRLSIVALLAGTEWAEFSWVRDSVELSDPALSKQVTKLAAGARPRSTSRSPCGNRWLPAGRSSVR